MNHLAVASFLPKLQVSRGRSLTQQIGWKGVHEAACNKTFIGSISNGVPVDLDRAFDCDSKSVNLFHKTVGCFFPDEPHRIWSRFPARDQLPGILQTRTVVISSKNW